MSIDIATWILAGFSAALVWVTWKLAKHTESLARLTGQLVHIEEQREQRIMKDKRNHEIAKALELAEKILEIDPDNFTENLILPNQFPRVEADYIRNFAIVSEHSLNADCVNNVNYLRDVIDRASHNPLDVPDGSKPNIKKALINLQENLPEPMQMWRTALTPPIMA